MRLEPAERALPQATHSRLRFDRAAPAFSSACFLHDEARRRLLDRLTGLSVVPDGVIVDIGSALGHGACELGERFPDARVVALDSSGEMLRRSVAAPAHARVLADAAALPFPDRSVSLLFGNLVLPWIRPDRLFAEARRVLRPGGLLVFSTLGPETLQEIRRAWLRIDDAIHVHAAFDIQTLGDLVAASGLEEPVLDVDRLEVTYADLAGAIRDLRAAGATNTAAGRRRGLTGRGHWHRFVEALWRDQGQGERGRLHLTVELIFGHAFGGHMRPNGEFSVPVEQLTRR